MRSKHHGVGVVDRSHPERRSRQCDNAAALDTELRDLFRAAGRDVEIVTLRPRQNPKEAARDASARAAIVVAAGDDGTVSSVAAGIAGIIESAAELIAVGLNMQARALVTSHDATR